MSVMQMSNEDRYTDTLKEMKQMLHQREGKDGTTVKKGKGILPAI